MYDHDHKLAIPIASDTWPTTPSHTEGSSGGDEYTKAVSVHAWVCAGLQENIVISRKYWDVVHLRSGIKTIYFEYLINRTSINLQHLVKESCVELSWIISFSHLVKESCVKLSWIILFSYNMKSCEVYKMISTNLTPNYYVKVQCTEMTKHDNKLF